MSDEAGSILVAKDLVARGGWFFESRWPFWQRKRLLNLDSLEIKQGELVAVMGLSGSGKSTLLRLLSGHGRAHRGQVILKHLGSIYETRRGAALGFLHQDEFLPPELDVKTYLVSTDQIRNVKPIRAPYDAKKVERWMKEVGIGALGSQPINRLSGGEQRRVSLCAELLSEPLFLFLDEPAANLDPYHSDMLYKLARGYADQKHGVVIVTHDLTDAVRFDKVVILKDGKVEFQGNPQEALKHYQADANGWRAVYEKLAQPEPTSPSPADGAPQTQDDSQVQSNWQEPDPGGLGDQKPAQSEPTSRLPADDASQPQDDSQVHTNGQDPYLGGLRESWNINSRIFWVYFWVQLKRQFRMWLSDRRGVLFGSLLLVAVAALFSGLFNYGLTRNLDTSRTSSGTTSLPTNDSLSTASEEGVAPQSSVAEESQLIEIFDESQIIQIFLFVSTLVAALIGLIGSDRDITFEKRLFWQEHMAGLSIVPYLLAKMIRAGAVATIYVLLFILLVSHFGVAVGCAESGGKACEQLQGTSAFAVAMSLTLCALANVAFRLAISTMVGSIRQSDFVVLVAMVIQLLFAGFFIPFSTAGVLRTIAQGVPTYWAYRALATVTDMSVWAPINSGVEGLEGAAPLPVWGWAAFLVIAFFLLAWVSLKLQSWRRYPGHIRIEHKPG